MEYSNFQRPGPHNFRSIHMSSILLVLLISFAYAQLECDEVSIGDTGYCKYNITTGEYVVAPENGVTNFHELDLTRGGTTSVLTEQFFCDCDCTCELDSEIDVCCNLNDEPTNCPANGVLGTSCCKDGSWSCNTPNGSKCPNQEHAPICPQCCEVAEIPDCPGSFDATCCSVGTWACDNKDGPTCDQIGESCTPLVDTPTVEETCCDLSSKRNCPRPFESSCCSDGTWKCDNAQGPSCGTTGNVCESDGEPEEEEEQEQNSGCCQNSEKITCPQNLQASCCAGGGWACDNLQGTTCSQIGEICVEEPDSGSECCSAESIPEDCPLGDQVGWSCCSGGNWMCNNFQGSQCSAPGVECDAAEEDEQEEEEEQESEEDESSSVTPQAPTEEPTELVTEPPTNQPTEEPTAQPTEEPTELVTEPPTNQPTEEPTAPPTEEPTEPPTDPPTNQPTEEPTEEPTAPPTEEPTDEPVEEASQEGCAINEWTCDDGECIPSHFYCDNVIDCTDFSDEDSRCGDAISCEANQWQCDDGECITDFFYCDRLVDCSDGSDEDERCGCASNQWTCNNAECIFGNYLCDGIEDCSDLSDEDPQLCGGGAEQQEESSSSSIVVEENVDVEVANVETTPQTDSPVDATDGNSEVPLIELVIGASDKLSEYADTILLQENRFVGQPSIYISDQLDLGFVTSHIGIVISESPPSMLTLSIYTNIEIDGENQPHELVAIAKDQVATIGINEYELENVILNPDQHYWIVLYADADFHVYRSGSFDKFLVSSTSRSGFEGFPESFDDITLRNGQGVQLALYLRGWPTPREREISINGENIESGEDSGRQIIGSHCDINISGRAGQNSLLNGNYAFLDYEAGRPYFISETSTPPIFVYYMDSMWHMGYDVFDVLTSFAQVEDGLHSPILIQESWAVEEADSVYMVDENISISCESCNPETLENSGQCVTPTYTSTPPNGCFVSNEELCLDHCCSNTECGEFDFAYFVENDSEIEDEADERTASESGLCCESVACRRGTSSAFATSCTVKVCYN